MKRKMFQKAAVLLVLALVFGCFQAGQTGVQAAKKKKPKLSKTKLTLTVGKKAKLKVKNKKGSVKWKTSNKKVATVSKKGVVKAVKAGKATISAKVKVGKKNKTLKCSVKVNKKKKKTNTQDSPADGGTNAQTPGGQTGNTPGGNTTGGNTPGGSTGTGGDGPSIQTPTDTPTGPSATPTQKPDKPSPVSEFMVTGKFMRNGVAEGGVEIEFSNHKEDDSIRRKAITLADGSYSVKLPADTYYLYADEYYLGSEWKTAITESRQLDIDVKGYRIEGAIKNSSGVSIDNAWVGLYREGSGYEDKTSRTNEEGKFRFFLIPQGSYQIKVGDEVLDSFTLSEDKSGLEYTVGKFNGVSGTLADVKGTPLSDSRIYVEDESGNTESVLTTNAEGKFSCALQPGNYTLSTPSGFGEDISKTFTVTSGETICNLSLPLQKVAGTLTRKGNECSGGTLQFVKKADDSADSSNVNVDVNENGTYSVLLLPGFRYEVYWHPWASQVPESIKVSDVTISSEGAVTGADITSDITKIEGTIKANGEVMKGTGSYHCRPQDNSSWSYHTFTYSDGKFTAYLEPDTYDVMFGDNKIGSLVVTTEDKSDMVLELNLFKISGVVEQMVPNSYYQIYTVNKLQFYPFATLQEDGSFLAYLSNGDFYIGGSEGCSVPFSVNGQNVADLSVALTTKKLTGTVKINDGAISADRIRINNDGLYIKEDNTYEIALPVGTYDVYYYNYKPSENIDISCLVDTVTIKNGENHKDFDITIYEMKGTVIDGDGNAYTASKTINFYDSSNTLVQSVDSYESAKGKYSVAFTKPGVYTVEVEAHGHKENCGQITIPEATDPITKDITYPIYHMSGQLLDKTGQPIQKDSGAKFYLYKIVDGNREPIGAINYDTDGNYTCDVFPGTYEIMYSGDKSDGYGVSEVSGTVTITDSSVTKNFQVKGSHVVSGKLKTAGGTPVADMRIQFYQNGSYVDEVRTDENGSYSVTLRAGTYQAKWCDAPLYYEKYEDVELGDVTVDMDDVNKDFISDVCNIHSKLYAASDLVQSKSISMSGAGYTGRCYANSEGLNLYVKKGTYKFYSNYYGNGVMSKTVEISSDYTEPIVLEGAYRISGTVYTDGELVSGTTIEIAKKATPDTIESSTRCNSDGEFEIFVHSLGDYVLYADGVLCETVSLTKHEHISGLRCDTSIIPEPAEQPKAGENQHVVDLSQVRFASKSTGGKAYVKGGNIYFTSASACNYVDLTDYMKKMKLNFSNCKTMEVSFDVFDRQGKQLNYNGTNSIMKAALVPADKLNGYDNVDGYITSWPTANGVKTFDLTTLSETAISNVAGLNFQLNSWDIMDSEKGYAESLGYYTLRINSIVITEGEGGNATLDLGGSNLSFQAKGENATEPKIIDNKVYFENGSTMNTVDFSSFLTERGIDLTGYSDIEIDFELLNSKGEVIDTSAKNDLKIALVDSASLDGYSDGIGDAERTDKLFTRYSGGKTTINLPKEAASDVKKIVGINLQLCNWNEGFSDLDYKTLCLKSIRLLK